MATYAVQGQIQPLPYGIAMAAPGAVAYTLTSADDGTELTGTGDGLVISSDASGWFHVASSADGATDKAGANKTHRVTANVPASVVGVLQGMFVSFLADA